MNKIEQLHSDAIKQSIQWVDWNLADRQINETASKSAEITGQIAIEFAEWLIKRLPPKYDCDTTTNYIPQVMLNEEEQLWTKGHGSRTEFYTTKELLQLWKEQQPKIVYYE